MNSVLDKIYIEILLNNSNCLYLINLQKSFSLYLIYPNKTLYNLKLLPSCKLINYINGPP
jgi:hypothetical protein